MDPNTSESPYSPPPGPGGEPGGTNPSAGFPPPPPPGQNPFAAPPPPQQNYYTPPPPQHGGPPAGVPGATTQDERLWGTFMHLSGIIVAILGSAMSIPMLNFLGPLILWLMKRHESRFLDDQGKEALNFNITVMIAFIVTFPLIFILIGFLLWFVIGVGALVLTIIAAIKANSGEYYRYPFTLRLVK